VTRYFVIVTEQGTNIVQISNGKKQENCIRQ